MSWLIKSIAGPFASALVGGACGNDDHVGKHQSLSAKAIGQSAPDSGAQKQHQILRAEPIRPTVVGRDMELRNDKRHRHAERKKSEPIEQGATGRKHPKPALDAFQAASHPAATSDVAMARAHSMFFTKAQRAVATTNRRISLASARFAPRPLPDDTSDESSPDPLLALAFASSYLPSSGQ